MLALLAGLVIALLATLAEADTEQAQVGPFLCFADPLGTASEETASHLATQWPVLKAASFPSTFTIPILAQARRHDASEDAGIDSKDGAWIVLDLHSSNAHTLRASWPGSFPADVTLNVFDTESMLQRGGVQTTINDTSLKDEPRDLRFQRPCRRAYAQIIAWRKGVPTPRPRRPQSWTLWQWLNDQRGNEALIESVPLHLTLEPLLLSAAPRTAVVFLLSALLPLLAVTWWVVVPAVLRWVNLELDSISACSAPVVDRLKAE